jgi:hypothetical protein
MRKREGFIIMDNAIVFEELQGGFVTQRTMGSDAVIDMLPTDKL